MLRFLKLVLLLFLVPASAMAQGGIGQSGVVTPGHVGTWFYNGVLGDGGIATNGLLSDVGVQNPGNGICQNSGPITGTYAQICLGFTGLIPTISTTTTSLELNLNGSVFTLPGSASCLGCGTMAGQNANAVAITGGTISGVTIPSIDSTFTATGTGAVATTVDATIRSRSLSEWQFSTTAQQSDARSLTASIDQTAAFQNWIAACIAQRVDCYLPPGKYLVNSAQILVDFSSVASNGIRIYGDNTATTIIDFGGSPGSHAGTTANPGTPPWLYEVASVAGATYGGLDGISFIGTYAGPMLQFGKTDYSDALNQMIFNISIQNYNTTSASTCAEFNLVLSSKMYMNCSTAAGPTGGNSAWIFREAQFNEVTMGASNAQYFLHMTGGTTSANTFVSQDCEVVTTCVLIDSSAAIGNTWVSGTWSYSWGASGYGVQETAGGNNVAVNPALNPCAPLGSSPCGSTASFLSSGSSTYFFNWSPASFSGPTFTGNPTTYNPTGTANFFFSSGTSPILATDLSETSAGNFTISNSTANATTTITQAGTSGVINLGIGTATPMTVEGAGIFATVPFMVEGTVNFVTLQGSATGVAPLISVAGTDTNVSLGFSTKGTGTLVVNGFNGVTCPANTVVLTTFAVTNGLVTHC